MSDKEILPPNATDLERALDRALARIGRVDLPIRELWQPQEIPGELLPWLAWTLSVDDEWVWANVNNNRRNLVADSVELHRRKGTPWAIRTALTSIGYESVTIEEGLPLIRHDASVAHGGNHTYGSGYRWALFRVRLDLGEKASLTDDDRQRAINLIYAYKNARSHLRGPTYEATVTEEVGTSEKVDTAVVKHVSELLPWGLRHDGAIKRDQGERVRHDGVWQHDGVRTFTSWRAAGHQYDNHWDKTDVAVRPALSDQPSVRADYGGHLHHSGFSRGSAPAVLDPAMPIQITRHQWHDGRHRHAGDLHDGEQAHDGARLYWMGLRYTGHQTTRAVI